MVIGAVAVVAQYGLAQGPKTDQQLATDMSEIQDKVDAFATKNKALPEKLSDVQLTAKLSKSVKQNNISYQKDDYNVFELCATFKTSTISKAEQARQVNDNVDGFFYDTPSSHDKGHQCFKRTAYGVDNPIDLKTSADSLSLHSSSSATSSSPSTIQATGSKQEAGTVTQMDLTNKKIYYQIFNSEEHNASWSTNPTVVNYKDSSKTKLSDIAVGDSVRVTLGRDGYVSEIEVLKS